MGGGDLNLKKSWHPQTLKNIERVWKAEQRHDAEAKKIEQLQKELQQERERMQMRQFAESTGVVKKKDDRLDWMYQGAAGMVNRDEYLLGRKVDKTFECLQREEEGAKEKNDTGIPESIFEQATDETVDLARKVREDPLFLIKKQEIEKQKALISNPIRLKMLKKMVEAEKDEKKRHKSKKHKRDKSPHEVKHKKHRHHSLSANDSDSDNDNKKRTIKRNDDHYSNQLKEQSSSSVTSNSRYGLVKKGDKGDNSNGYEKKDYRILMAEKRRREESEARKRLERRNNGNSSLTAEEKERRRREMMQDASWRDEQRIKLLEKAKREDEYEDRERKRNRKFVAPRPSADYTLERRVKENLKRVQRSHDNMEKHFARRQ